MEVRDLASDDLEGLYSLRMNRYEEVRRDPAYGMGTRSSPPTIEDFTPGFTDLHRAVVEGTGVCSVAVVDGRLVGMARVLREDDALETKHVGVLSIEVLPGFRGRGIGTALLGHALDACRGRFELVKLETLPENSVGQRLYRKFRFEVHGRLPRAFYRAGEYHDFLLMHRAVPPR